LTRVRRVRAAASSHRNASSSSRSTRLSCHTMGLEGGTRNTLVMTNRMCAHGDWVDSGSGTSPPRRGGLASGDADDGRWSETRASDGSPPFSRRRRAVVGARGAFASARPRPAARRPPPHVHVCLAPTSTRYGLPARPSSRTTKDVGPGRPTRNIFAPDERSPRSARATASQGLARHAASRSDGRDIPVRVASIRARRRRRARAAVWPSRGSTRGPSRHHLRPFRDSRFYINNGSAARKCGVRSSPASPLLLLQLPAAEGVSNPTPRRLHSDPSVLQEHHVRRPAHRGDVPKGVPHHVLPPVRSRDGALGSVQARQGREGDETVQRRQRVVREVNHEHLRSRTRGRGGAGQWSTGRRRGASATDDDDRRARSIGVRRFRCGFDVPSSRSTSTDRGRARRCRVPW
jgi:hypothetical protein